MSNRASPDKVRSGTAVVVGFVGAGIALTGTPILSAGFLTASFLSVTGLLRARRDASDAPYVDTITPLLSETVLLALLIAWWRPIAFIGSAVSVALIGLLAFAAVTTSWHSRSLEPGETPFSRRQWDGLLRSLGVSVGLAAATIGSVFWPTTSGSIDGRMEGIVAVAAVAVVLFWFQRPDHQPIPRPTIIGMALFAVLVCVVGAGDLLKRPELALAAVIIGMIQVVHVFRIWRRAPIISTAQPEPGTISDALKSAFLQSLAATGIVVALMTDWVIRHPS